MNHNFDDSLDLYSPTYNSCTWSSWHDVNPANGLPMLPGGVDIRGNPYGVDYD